MSFWGFYHCVSIVISFINLIYMLIHFIVELIVYIGPQITLKISAWTAKNLKALKSTYYHSGVFTVVLVLICHIYNLIHFCKFLIFGCHTYNLQNKKKEMSKKEIRPRGRGGHLYFRLDIILVIQNTP